MKHYRGSTKVEPGIYFNLRELSFKSMPEEGTLPGTEIDEYRKVPAIVLLVVGPVLGLVYGIFLPFIGLAMVGWLLVGKLAELARDAAGASLRVLRPAWQPAYSFLTRTKAGDKPAKRVEKKDAWAEEVRKEAESDEAK